MECHKDLNRFSPEVERNGNCKFGTWSLTRKSNFRWTMLTFGLFLENGWLWKLVNEVGSAPLDVIWYNIIIYIHKLSNFYFLQNLWGWILVEKKEPAYKREREGSWAYLGRVELSRSCMFETWKQGTWYSLYYCEYASGLKSGTFRRFILVVKEDYCFRTCWLHHIVARLAWRFALFSVKILGDICFPFVQDTPVQEDKDPYRHIHSDV